MEEKTLNALRWIVGIFEAHQIQYQISGGFAAKLYGSSRLLNDIDIDISEKRFTEILPEIQSYITYGPNRYKDGKWELDLITLNYNGQEIDIGGADDARISNKERTAWISLPPVSSKALDIEVGGTYVKVIPPLDLIEYKSELDGDHQAIDIEAVKGYCLLNGL